MCSEPRCDSINHEAESTTLSEGEEISLIKEARQNANRKSPVIVMITGLLHQNEETIPICLLRIRAIIRHKNMDVSKIMRALESRARTLCNRFLIYYAKHKQFDYIC